MFDTIAGLPMHPMVVHATVVVVPAAALVVGLAGVWPRFRARTGPLALVLSTLALILVPVTIQSGKALREDLPTSELVDRHGDLGTSLLPWVVALVLAAGATGWLRHREMARIHHPAGPGGGSDDSDGSAPGPVRVPRLVPVVVAVLAVAAAAGVVGSVVRIGHSGAEAAWSDVAAMVPGLLM